MAPLFSFPAAALSLSVLAATEPTAPRELGFVGGKVTYSGTEADQLNGWPGAAQGLPSGKENPFATFANFAAAESTSDAHVVSSKTLDLGGPPLIPETGSSIMDGMISSFLAGLPLASGEEQCLQRGSAALGGEVAEVSQHIVTLGEAVMAENGLGKSQPSSSTTSRPSTKVAARRLQGAGAAGLNAGMMLSGAASALELGSEIKKMGKLGHQILSKCLQSDGKDTLREAAENAESFQYLRKALASNGPVMMRELSEAIDAWHENSPMQFGASVGAALRLVFLTTDTSGALPEGLPDKKTLTNLTGGFLQGFFGPGMGVTIKTPETGPKPISIDLSKCVGENAKFLENMWASTVRLHAQQAAAQSENIFVQPAKPSFPERLAYSLMQVPESLKECSIGEEQEQELKDAIASMGQGVHLSFQAPEAALSKSQVLDRMGSTMDDYRQLVSQPSTGGTFGQKLGSFMQGALGTAMSKKYVVDEHGNLLKRELANLSTGSALTSTHSSQVLVPALLVFISTLLLLAAVKIHRSLTETTAVHGEDLEACASSEGKYLTCDAIE